MVFKFKRDMSNSIEEQPINTWRPELGLDGITYPTIRDSNEDWFGIQTHKIDENGNVFPSVVCDYEGCGFHKFIKLEGWEEIPEPKQH